MASHSALADQGSPSLAEPSHVAAARRLHREAALVRYHVLLVLYVLGRSQETSQSDPGRRAAPTLPAPVDGNDPSPAVSWACHDAA